MTPEEAQALEPGLTPGGWNVDGDEYGDEILSVLAVTYDGQLIRGRRVAEEIDNPHDARLIASAPDMRATIAALRWEYAVENSDGDFLDLNDDAYSGVEVLWTWHRTVAEEVQAACGGTLVRRLGGPMEVVE